MTLRITTDMDPTRAMFIGTGIPPRYRHLDILQMASGPDRPWIGLASEWAVGWPDQQRTDIYTGLPAHPDAYGRGLLLAGAPGRGKTTIALSVLCTLRRHFGTRVYFVRWPEYMDCARELLSNNEDYSDAKQRAYRVLDAVADTPVVCLDDVGHEHTTASRYAEDTLHQLLRDRYQRGLATLITTNLTGEAWRDTYTDACRSFITEACLVVPFTGPSLRSSHAER
jgi:DNA replication protein DnaC